MAGVTPTICSQSRNQREGWVNRLQQFTAAVFLLAGTGWVPAAQAQDVVKYGVIGQFTGPFAVTGEQYKQGIEAFLAQNGATLGRRKIELVYRDTGGPNPAQAKRLAEELLVRDKVAILGGLYLSPEAAAAAPAVNETKTPTLLFNAASPSLMPASAYFVRMGQNIAVPGRLGAEWSRGQGKSRGYTVVGDYTPGHDTEVAFVESFTAAGGQIVGKDRVPLNTVDFAPYAERIANANPDVLEVFIPPGAAAVSFIKALAARGLTQKILIIGQGEAEDSDLHLFDDSVVGFHSIIYYSSTIDSPENNDLKSTLRKKFGADVLPSSFTLGAYDSL
ncbi:MAG TPA: ABC transporter substrate-binding protein, partial [Methylomirabilota bacterium]|nr:ABC transporter substrate-binding protein [Methylomirabilota bacterium]